MIGEVIKEYLVSLGVQIDKPGFNQMKTTLDQTSGTVATATSGWAKNFVSAGAIIGTALASVSASIAGVMTAAAKQDLSMEKYARGMLVSKSAALEMKTAIDALGESVQDIQLTPELMNRYRSLVSDGRNMKVSGDYEGTMKNFRDLLFEFTRLKQEASYALQWVGYYLMKHLSKPLADAKATFKSFNDNLIKTMPVWTEKIARAFVYIINVGKHFLDLLKAIGKTIYDVWDAFPRGIKIATAALAGFFMLLRASPVGRMVALISSLLLMVDDYFGHMEGKQAAMGSAWDRLNDYMDVAKQKLTEWGEKLAPVWDSFVGYLTMARDGVIDLSGKFSDWIQEVGQSAALSEFVTTIQELGSALYELGPGFVEWVTAAFRDLLDSLQKHDMATKFTDLMDRLKGILWGLFGVLKDGIQTVAQWFNEIARSEEMQGFIDALVEMFGALMDLFNALMDLVTVAFSGFYGEMEKTQKAYTFRDTVKAVVGMISSMVRVLSTVIEFLAKFFKMMADNQLFKEFWRGMGQAVKVFSDIVFGAIGMVSKLGQALLALVRGDFKQAAKLAGEAFSGKAEAGRRFRFEGDGRPYGALSIEGESGGDPGVISSGEGDMGGKSYGLYQFASKWGNERKFANWAAKNYPEIGNALLDSNDFDATWRELAQTKREEFSKAQRDYAELVYFKPAVEELQAKGFDITKRSTTLQEVLWSNAVQHAAYAPDAFTDLEKLGYDLNSMSDEEIIKALYKNKIDDPTWSSGSPSQRPGLFHRWSLESEKALEMLNQEREYNRNQQQKVDDIKSQPAFQNPPTGMRDSTMWDRLRDWWDQFRKPTAPQNSGASTESSAGLVRPSAYFANGFINADPMLLSNLMQGSSPAYTQNSGSNITNITYQVDVGGVEVKNTNASADDIGKAVGDKTASSINDRATYVLQNRALNGIQV